MAVSSRDLGVRRGETKLMTGIHLQTFGGLRVRLDGRELPNLPAQPVRCALLVYLAVERGATRDALMALLWPESDTERARRSLSQTLYELRRGLGDDWLEIGAERVAVTPSVSVDALEFVAAVGTGAADDALALYRGAFLAGSHLAATNAFETWVERQRSRLGLLHGELCRRLVSDRAAAGDLEGALAVARQRAELDPLDDEAQHAVIDLLAQAGRRSDALRRYEEYQALLARELQVEPLEQTQQLVARIRAGGESPIRRPASTPRAEAAPPALGRQSTSVPPEAGGRAERRNDERGGRPVRRRSALGGPGVRAALAAALLAIAVAGAVMVVRSSQTPTSAEALEAVPASVAVLPFLNLSADPEQEYFSDGIAEDLLTSLCRVEGLRVISRASAWHYKGSASPIREIARELGVGYVLQGSVRREGEQVRVSAGLVDASSEAQLWAETYDRELEDIFRIQSEIAQRIAGELRRRFSREDHARIAARPASLAAYDFVLRGREYLNRPGEADIRKFEPATRFFRQALEFDPSYAAAYVGLSEAFRAQPGLPLTVRRDSALAFARKAVELDPASAEAAAALGWALLIARQPESADTALHRALTLDRNQVRALSGLARLAWIRGAFDDAVRWQRRAAALDPSSAQQVGTLGSFLLDIGDLDGAEAAYRRAAELAPDGPAASFLLAQTALIRGEPARAEQQMRALAAAASDHPGTRFLMGRFHAQRGRYAEAEAQLERAAEALGGVGATLSLQRAYLAKRRGQDARFTELLRDAELDLDAREREGAHAPRLRLQLQALAADRAAALETLRRNEWHELAGDLLAGPQIGLYWIDRDPLLEELRDDPAFQARLGEMRAALDALRARLP